MTVLNQPLYDALCRRFNNQVGITNEGQPQRVKPTPRPDPKTGRQRKQLQVVEYGETYTVPCPFCDDHHRHLSINHCWGERHRGTGTDRLWQAKCFRNDCLNKRSRQEDLYDRVFPLGRSRRSRVQEASSRTRAQARTFSLPASVESLLNVKGARFYLEGRDFSPQEIAADWDVQYCCCDQTAQPNVIDSLVIPVYGIDAKGNRVLAGWQSRKLSPIATPKYQTVQGMKVSEVLYGIDKAIKTSGPLVIVEGVTDAWRLRYNVVATFGKSISHAQAKLLKRHFSDREIVLMYDADAQTEARDAQRKLRDLGLSVMVGKLPAGKKDIGECTHDEAWQCVENALGQSAGSAVKPKQNAKPYDPACGQVFNGKFALVCQGASGSSFEIAASDGKKQLTIAPANLGDFILAHRKVPVIFHDAAQTFWSIYDYLTETDQSKAANVWLKRLRNRSMHDTMMLDMLVKLANDPSAEREPAKLEEIAGEHLVVSPQANVLSQSRAIARTHQALRHQARKLLKDYGYDRAAKEHFDIDPLATQKFGLLTERLQVAAAITLHRISVNGVHVDQQQRTSLLKDDKQKLGPVIAALNQRYPFALKRSGSGDPIIGPTGLPTINLKGLESYLKKLAVPIGADTDGETLLPRLNGGQLSMSPAEWKRIAGNNALIKLWAQLDEAEHRCRFLKQLNAPVLHPNYHALCRTGRTSCSSPNIQQIPRDDRIRELIVPSPGQLFLIVDYKFIELVTLAAICERRYGKSRLAAIIRHGIDPHCYTASMLLNQSYDQFMRLKHDEPAKFKTWRQMAKPINFGVPGGMGAKALVKYAKNSYGVAMTLAQAEQFRGCLINQVYPELRLFLAGQSTGKISTLSGRIRSDVSNTEERNTQFQGLASDGAKLALANLVAEGHRVVAFVHDEILVELPDAGRYAHRQQVDQVVGIIRSSMAEVTYGVPVECEYAVATCWSKRAELIQDGDRICAWQPPAILRKQKAAA